MNGVESNSNRVLYRTEEVGGGEWGPVKLAKVVENSEPYISEAE